MFKKLFGRKPEQQPEPPRRRVSAFSTDEYMPSLSREARRANALSQSFQKPMPTVPAVPGVAMDAISTNPSQMQIGQTIPEAQLLWYASQGFIGTNLSAMLSQHWLISKACLMPAKDAVRNGYKITRNDGEKIDEKIVDEIRRLDVRYKLTKNFVEFVQMGRIFGVRIALFVVEGIDYEKPFNIDGVKPGSYRGISQIDPYWITAELDALAAGDPMSINFQEPTWWKISGRRVHRSHLAIFRTEEVPDILKPTYVWGGIPIPQKIYERVYAAERTANEAPQLVLSKRTNVIKVDIAAALANQPAFDAKMQAFAYNRDNYGIKTIDTEDEMEQFDTALADLDAVIMTQYQIVAAAAEVPAVKLLGTSPKGFNATGEYEEASYHEMLESIQTHDLTPLAEGHHQRLIRSEICPLFKIAPFETTVIWNELDAMTGEEQAALNKLNAETGVLLVNAGAINGDDERDRIINDPMSGYSGLQGDAPDVEDDDENTDEE